MQGALKNQARIIDSFLTIAILIPVLQLLVHKMDTFIPCQLIGVLWKWLHGAGKELRERKATMETNDSISGSDYGCYSHNAQDETLNDEDERKH